MSKPVCPMCEMAEILQHADRYEGVACGHEISCKMEGIAVGPKACFVKRA